MWSFSGPYSVRIRGNTYQKNSVFGRFSRSGSQYLPASSEAPSKVLSHFLWCNNYIEIEDAVVHFEKFSNKISNFLLQLFENGKIISRANLKDEYDGKHQFLITVMLARKICISIIMLLKKLEFCLPTNYALWKYIRF